MQLETESFEDFYEDIVKSIYIKLMNFDNQSKYKLKAVVDCIGKNSTKLGYFDGRNQHIHKKGLKTIQKSCDVRVSINQIKNLIQAKNKILDKGNGVYRISVNAANILQTELCL